MKKIPLAFLGSMLIVGAMFMSTARFPAQPVAGPAQNPAGQAHEAHLDAAFQALQTAASQLAQAQGHFEGHHRKAEQLVNEAGKEINLAIEANARWIAGEKKTKKK